MTKFMAKDMQIANSVQDWYKLAKYKHVFGRDTIEHSTCISYSAIPPAESEIQVL